MYTTALFSEAQVVTRSHTEEGAAAEPPAEAVEAASADMMDRRASRCEARDASGMPHRVFNAIGDAHGAGGLIQG